MVSKLCIPIGNNLTKVKERTAEKICVLDRSWRPLHRSRCIALLLLLCIFNAQHYANRLALIATRGIWHWSRAREAVCASRELQRESGENADNFWRISRSIDLHIGSWSRAQLVSGTVVCIENRFPEQKFHFRLSVSVGVCLACETGLFFFFGCTYWNVLLLLQHTYSTGGLVNKNAVAI